MADASSVLGALPARTCRGCGNIIALVDRFAAQQNWYFHKACFRCAACGRLLPAAGYLTHSQESSSPALPQSLLFFCSADCQNSPTLLRAPPALPLRNALRLRGVFPTTPPPPRRAAPLGQSESPPPPPSSASTSVALSSSCSSLDSSSSLLASPPSSPSPPSSSSHASSPLSSSSSSLSSPPEKRDAVQIASFRQARQGAASSFLSAHGRSASASSLPVRTPALSSLSNGSLYCLSALETGRDEASLEQPSSVHSSTELWRVEDHRHQQLIDEPDRQTAKGFFLIDRDFYTPYYAHYFYGRPHRLFMCRDAGGLPVVIAVEQLLPADERPAEMLFLRAYVITARTASSKSEAEHWILVPVGIAPDGKLLRQFLLSNLPPDVGIASRLLEVTDAGLPQQIFDVEQTLRANTSYKFGVLCALDGQTSESAMIASNTITPEFQAFLDLLGPRQSVLGHAGFTGGLPNTEEASVIVTQLSNFPIAFHVAPYLRYDPDDRQQLPRKRHIGNDVAVVIFKQTSERLNVAALFRSQFIHVVLVVEIDAEQTAAAGVTHYRLFACSKYGCHSFAPLIPAESMPADQIFRTLLLLKLVNSERSSAYLPVFANRLQHATTSLFQEKLEPFLAKLKDAAKQKPLTHDPTALHQPDLVQKMLIKDAAKKNKAAKRSSMLFRKKSNSLLVTTSPSRQRSSTAAPAPISVPAPPPVAAPPPSPDAELATSPRRKFDDRLLAKRPPPPKPPAADEQQ